jgi:hypothetical protein
MILVTVVVGAALGMDAWGAGVCLGMVLVVASMVLP